MRLNFKNKPKYKSKRKRTDGIYLLQYGHISSEYSFSEHKSICKNIDKDLRDWI